MLLVLSKASCEILSFCAASHSFLHLCGRNVHANEFVHRVELTQYATHGCNKLVAFGREFPVGTLNLAFLDELAGAT